jgi:NADH-quinone oxidoreductase subunit L
MMVVSVAIALIGIYLAYLFYIKKPELPGKLAASFKGLYRLVLEKYRIDELYDFLFVNHIKWWCTTFMKVDNQVVDGAVNGSAWLTRLSSSISIWNDKYIVDGLVNLIGWMIKIKSFIFRRFQTGYVQNYALMIIFGVVVITCIYLFF